MSSNPRRDTSEKKVWYADGIRFQCQRCGCCCGGEPGYVWVERPEIVRMSEHLGISVAEFRSRYLRRVGFRLSLIEKPNGDCILLRDGRCTVYSVRPLQCRTFPFWEDALNDPEWFQRALRGCPGVGKGKLYTLAEIERISTLGFPTENPDDSP